MKVSRVLSVALLVALAGVGCGKKKNNLTPVQPADDVVNRSASSGPSAKVSTGEDGSSVATVVIPGDDGDIAIFVGPVQVMGESVLTQTDGSGTQIAVLTVGTQSELLVASQTIPVGEQEVKNVTYWYVKDVEANEYLLVKMEPDQSAEQAKQAIEEEFNLKSLSPKQRTERFERWVSEAVKDLRARAQEQAQEEQEQSEDQDGQAQEKQDDVNQDEQ